MKMLEVPSMPTEGQFIGMWIYEGKIWCNTYRWIDGVLHQYLEDVKDYFFRDEFTLEYVGLYDPRFFVAEEVH